MIGGFMGFTGDRGTFCVSLKVSATGVAYIYIYAVVSAICSVLCGLEHKLEIEIGEGARAESVSCKNWHRRLSTRARSCR